MTAGQRHLQRQIRGATYRPRSRITRAELVMVFVATVLMIAVGMVMPAYVWFRIRPDDPDLAETLLTLTVCGWLFYLVALTWPRRR